MESRQSKRVTRETHIVAQHSQSSTLTSSHETAARSSRVDAVALMHQTVVTSESLTSAEPVSNAIATAEVVPRPATESLPAPAAAAAAADVKQLQVLSLRVAELEQDISAKSQENSDLLLRMDALLSHMETMASEAQQSSETAEQLQAEIERLSCELATSQEETRALSCQVNGLRTPTKKSTPALGAEKIEETMLNEESNANLMKTRQADDRKDFVVSDVNQARSASLRSGYAAMPVFFLVLPALVVQLAGAASRRPLLTSAHGLGVLLALVASLVAPRLENCHDCTVLVACAGVSFLVSLNTLLVPLDGLPAAADAVGLSLAALSVSVVFQIAPAVLMRCAPSLPRQWAAAAAALLVTVGGVGAAVLQSMADSSVTAVCAAGFLGLLAACLTFLVLGQRADPRVLIPKVHQLPMEKLFRHYAFVVLAAACATSAFLLQLIDSSRHSLTKDSSLAVAVAFIVCAAGLLLALGSPAEMAPSCVTLAVAQMAALALGVQSVLLFQGGIAGAALGLCLRHGGGFPSTIGLVHGLTALFSLIAVVSVVSGLTSEKNVGLTVAWASVLFYVVNAFVFTPVEDEDPAEGEYASV